MVLKLIWSKLPSNRWIVLTSIVTVFWVILMKQLPGRDTIWFKLTALVILLAALLVFVLIVADMIGPKERDEHGSRAKSQFEPDDTDVSDGSYIPDGVIRPIGRKRKQGGDV